MIWTIPMYALAAYFVIQQGLVGLWVSRWHGGGWGIPAPRWVKNAVWSLPFALVGVYCAGWLVGLAAGGLCLAGKATGHGRGQSLKEPLTGKPEFLEYLVLPLWPYLSTYWYKVCILSVIGLAAVSGGVLAFAWGGFYWSAAIAAVGGLLGKPAAYMLGWKVYPHQNGAGIINLNQATQIGEAGTGFCADLALSIAFLVALLFQI